MLKNLNKRKMLVYVVIPLIFTVVLAGMYFSRNNVLQRLVSPKLPPLPVDAWREFGLLENMQNACLLVMFIVCLAGVWRATERLQRIAFAMVGAFTMFVLLEEIDYGAHWYRYFTSDAHFQWFKPLSLNDLLALAQNAEEESTFNLHNQGELTKVFKFVGDFTIGFIFVLMPLVALRARNRYIQYAAPDMYAILTVVVMVAFSKIIHLVGKVDKHFFKEAVLSGTEPSWEIGSISSNLSEFRELNIYYLFMVYLITLVFCRALQQETEQAEPCPDAQP